MSSLPFTTGSERAQEARKDNGGRARMWAKGRPDSRLSVGLRLKARPWWRQPGRCGCYIISSAPGLGSRLSYDTECQIKG
jgi:hypothetical protein